MYTLSAQELNRSFVEGSYSAEKIIAYFLRRIHQFDPQISSLLNILQDRVQQKALALDKKRSLKQPLGSLAGVPILIKDNINIRGETTTCGSKFLKNYIAPYNATVVSFLEEEDALIIAKSNLDEFAMGSSNEKSAFFPTKNPWNLSCVPGGSSGGSAAAVAARLAPVGFGSDTGGSIRQPAALCGIVGFKPTYGRVSRYGLVAFGSSLDQIGPLTTNVSDCGLIMNIIGKNCSNDATSINLPQENHLKHLSNDFHKMTIGVPWNFLENIAQETSDNFHKALKTIEGLGGKIVDINLDILKYAIPVYYILATAEASTNLARFDGIRYGMRSKKAKNLTEVYDLSREEGFGPEVKKRIMLGTYVLSAGYQDAYYRKAQKVRKLIINAFKTAFSHCDLVAMPVSPTKAFPIGGILDPIEMYLQDLFTVGANLAGIPAISIPSGFSPDHMPFGLQLLAPQMQDAKVLRYAYAFEKATLYGTKIPPLFDKEHA
ncbi:MAG: Asp-tRNA(Asn)/Glu-tRNA(Gln) amidotransferase subunit GatA [Parachlamydiales bacterium]|nr:Asp-tRNA(Asn)/Glu-tRNA(Gln) amidotransferase subunit GatA [Parachlamydiales bacterium]